MSAALSTQGLEQRYGATTALAGVDLEVGEGELFGLLGPNGAGKSTLVKIACGLVRPSRGQAEICGARAGSLDARRRLGYLAELFRFPGWYSADELLNIIDEGTVRMAALLRAADESQRAKMGASLERRIEPWRRGDGYAVPAPVKIAAGTKPGR